MLGLLRNGLRVSNRPLSLARPVSLLNGDNYDSSRLPLTCQQCCFGNNIVNGNSSSFSQTSTRFFSTMRTLVGSGTLVLGENRLLTRCSLLTGVTGPEDSWTMTSGGPYHVQSRGMKFKGRVKRRCKDCYLQWINGMLYNLCKTHPRHKHGLKPAYYANQRCMTHATMSPKRPW